MAEALPVDEEGLGKMASLGASKDKNEEEVSISPEFSTVFAKVLENDLILRIICKDYCVSDLKNFRSVCWKWKKASEKTFRSKARIYINSSKGLIGLMENFEKFYAGRKCEGSYPIPITALTITGFTYDPMKTSFFNMFFEYGMGRFITDLNFKDTPLRIDQWQYLTQTFDFDINKMIPKGVKKLIIRPRLLHDNRKLCIPIRALQNVDVIDFFDMKLNYSGEKIAPKELLLNYVKAFVEGKTEEVHLLNKFLDFTNLKKLRVVDTWWKLDMSEKDVSLDLLCLNTTKSLLNTENCNWAIKKAEFIIIKNDISNLNIKQLETTGSSKIDLTYLPSTLQELNLFYVARIISRHPPNLPHLKILKLKCSEDHLVRVTMNVALIPPSVTTIELENNIVITGQRKEVHELETLTHKHFHARSLLNCLGTTLKKLKPQNLILSERINILPDGKDDLLKIFMACQFSQHVTIGNEEWSIADRMKMRLLQNFFN